MPKAPRETLITRLSTTQFDSSEASKTKKIPRKSKANLKVDREGLIGSAISYLDSGHSIRVAKEMFILLTRIAENQAPESVTFQQFLPLFLSSTNPHVLRMFKRGEGAVSLRFSIGDVQGKLWDNSKDSRIRNWNQFLRSVLGPILQKLALELLYLDTRRVRTPTLSPPLNDLSGKN